MDGSWIAQLMVFIAILTVVAVFLGEYLAKVYNGEPTFMSPLLVPLEKALYKVCRIDAAREMDWKAYTVDLVAFNIIGIVALFLIQSVQHLLPLNPQKMGPLSWALAFNTAVSFVTNTNWQNYGGESTMSYLTQMLGMTVQNFLSAAVGMAAAVAFMRAFVRQSVTAIGNYWVDLTRSIVHVLLPLSFVFSLFLVSQGVIQNVKPYVTAVTLEGRQQIIAQGPVASQVAIKMLGTNGGGFFNANSAHPYENPTPLTDYLEILSFLAIAAAFPFAFGALLGNRKQGWALYSAMMALYLLGLAVVIYAEYHGNPLLSKLGISGGMNMEGKEVRFGGLSSLVFAHATTVTSCGAVNCMHDSLMPLAGMMLMFNMAIGEVIFGGVGTGLISMIIYAIMTMFLVGLMIGRTPEIFGKKLEPYEMIMSVVILLSSSVVQLVLSAFAISSTLGLSAMGNAGPHGLSEILYAFISMTGNNGSAFGGLGGNTVFFNLAGAMAMLIGRFSVIIPALAIAGSLANKKMVPKSVKFPTASPLFVVMLTSVIVVVGALTFFPPLTLGPLLEHLFVLAGRTF